MHVWPASGRTQAEHSLPVLSVMVPAAKTIREGRVMQGPTQQPMDQSKEAAVVSWTEGLAPGCIQALGAPTHGEHGLVDARETIKQ
jgi:hypothetical protein